MNRKETASYLASLWIPVAAIMSIAILAAFSARFSSSLYWAFTSIPIVILIFWKMRVRHRASLTRAWEPTPEQIARLRPYAGLFLAIYFSSAAAFLGYGTAAWYYQLDFSWTFFITFLSLWAIKIDVWAIIVRHSISESCVSSRP